MTVNQQSNSLDTMHNAIPPWQQRHVKPSAKVSSKIKKNLSRTSRASSDSCMSLRGLVISVLLLAMHLHHSTNLPEDWICIWGKFLFLNFDRYSILLTVGSCCPGWKYKVYKYSGCKFHMSDNPMLRKKRASPMILSCTVTSPCFMIV